MNIFIMAAQYKPLVYVYYMLAFLAVHARCTNFEYGKTYKYTYDTKVLFNDQLSKKATRPQQDVGLHMTLEFDFTPVFHSSDAQFIKLQVTSATLSSAHRSGMEGQLMDMVKFPVYFEYMDGMVGRIYAVDSDSVFCVNIKKGIASMFQVQTQEGERMELDVSGECKTIYKISGPTIVKQKLECENLEIAGQHSNENGVFGITSTSSSTWTYQMENGVVRSMMGSNKHVASLNVKTSLNAMVMAVQKLTFLSTGALQEEDKLPGSDFEEAVGYLKQGSNYPIVEMLLPSAPESQQCAPNSCQKPSDVLKEVKDSITEDKVATIESAKAFLKLLKSFRNAGKDAISEAMTGPESRYIVPQLLDVAVATQTPAAQKAMMELLNFEEASNVQYPLRYLLGVAYSTHPGDYLIKDLMSMLKARPGSPQVKEGMALALGAAIYTYCRVEEQCDDKVVEEYRTMMMEELSKCMDEACRLLYIRSMGNSGLPHFMKEILATVSSQTSSSMLAFNAMQALRRIPTQYIVEETRSILRIFHQTDRTYDTSVRAAAAELLLDNNATKATVLNILLTTVGDQAQFELSTFLLRKVVDMMKYNENLREVVAAILSDEKVNNYNMWAQKGKSSAFSSLLAETQDANATYGLYMETAKSGVMKKSFMDVNLVSRDSIQKMLSFGIYASGLESLLGEEPDADTGEEEATAGLALKILDVLLPPVEFFRGSGGLMSAVWNAPSDPISALAVSFMLQDHSEKFHLANGLVVDLQVLGVTSIDLTGLVSISLWNRNSESLIRNSGSLVVEGSMQLDSDIGRVGAVFTAEGEAYIDFTTDVDFYEAPFKMCMQMKRPKITFKHTLNKYEKAKKFDRSYKSKVSKTSYVDGLSYFLSQKNSEECKALLANK